MRIGRLVVAFTMAAGVAGVAGDGYAQCAGCGADYNKLDREATARLAERQRLEKIDPPAQKDPLGNALISGGIAGIVKGSIVAGARAVVTSATVGAALQKARESRRK